MQPSITFQDQVKLFTRIALMRLHIADGLDIEPDLELLEQDISMLPVAPVSMSPDDHAAMPSSTTTAIQIAE